MAHEDRDIPAEWRQSSSEKLLVPEQKASPWPLNVLPMVGTYKETCETVKPTDAMGDVPRVNGATEKEDSTTKKDRISIITK